jgi:hypothetical protein
LYCILVIKVTFTIKVELTLYDKYIVVINKQTIRLSSIHLDKLETLVKTTSKDKMKSNDNLTRRIQNTKSKPSWPSG